MGLEIKIEIIKTEMVKPSSPTPNHLKSFRLSVFDQFAPVVHTRLLLFFPKTGNDKTSQLLKNSLSQTLNSFYPFAGRLRENLWIDCNDDGAEFVETNVKCALSTITDEPDSETLEWLGPSNRAESEEFPLLLVQANSFGCGGMAIGLSISHKVADASTISLFLRCWSTKTRNSESQIKSSLLPRFVSSSLFPPQDSLALLPQDSKPTGQSRPEKLAIRRLVFHGLRISALRSRLSSETVRTPTRVEAAMALIWKCAMEASRAVSGAGSKSVLFQAVNLHGRVVSVPTENLSGNFYWTYAVKCGEAEKEAEPWNLVALLRRGIEEFKQGCESRIKWEGLSGDVEEYVNLRKNGDVDIFMATSWCRFPFYEMDFGWGKPSWVCVPPIRHKNCIVLMDRRSDDDFDGLEVLLYLGEQQMTHFERNQELLEFASFNPSATE